MMPQDFPWFALVVKPRHEKMAAACLKGKGYPEFLPLYEKRTYVGKRARSAELPLFPQYVFSRFNPNDRLPVLTIPGVFAIVSIGKVPAPVDDKEIESIQAMVHSGRVTSPWPYVEAGQIVRVIEGPLRGLEGVLLCIKSKCRLVVSLTLLKRSVAVELDRETIAPVIPRRPPGFALSLDCRGAPASITGICS